MCWTIVSEIFQIAINLCIWNSAPCPISPTHTAHSSLVLTSVLSPGPCTLLQWPELKVSAYTSAPTRVAFDKSRRDLSRLFAKLKKTRFENLMRLTICLFWWQLVVDNNTRAFILDMLFFTGDTTLAALTIKPHHHGSCIPKTAKLDHLQRIMLQGDFGARIQSFQNSGGSCSNTNGKPVL